MTRQEAIRWIQLDIDMAKFDPSTGEEANLNDDARKVIEAQEMAIEVLKANGTDINVGSTDAISRQAAIDALDKRFDDVPMELTTETLLLRKDLREVIPSAQPEERTNEHTKTHACDLISRQAVLSLPKSTTKTLGGEIVSESVEISDIEELPSVQPEPTRGEWEIYEISPFDGEGCRCSECRFEGVPYWNFCPNCGADMRGEKE